MNFNRFKKVPGFGRVGALLEELYREHGCPSESTGPSTEVQGNWGLLKDDSDIPVVVRQEFNELLCELWACVGYEYVGSVMHKQCYKGSDAWENYKSQGVKCIKRNFSEMLVAWGVNKI